MSLHNVTPVEVSGGQAPAGGSFLMKEAEVAAVLRLKVSTLRAWRLNGKGPIFVKLGSAVRYRRDDVERYIEFGRVSGDRVQ